MSILPILYSFRRCPYAMRARLAINVSGVKVELREILLRDKPPQMLEVSPKGTVPVLIEPDGNVLEESLDIMDWALAINDPQDWLKPEKGSLEEMRQLINQNHVMKILIHQADGIANQKLSSMLGCPFPAQAGNQHQNFHENGQTAEKIPWLKILQFTLKTVNE